MLCNHSHEQEFFCPHVVLDWEKQTFSRQRNRPHRKLLLQVTVTPRAPHHVPHSLRGTLNVRRPFSLEFGVY